MDANLINQWSRELGGEIETLEARVRPLLKEIAEKKEKLSAMKRLLGPNTREVASNRSASPAATSVTSSSPYTQTIDYWIPILESLVQLGGRAQSEAVIDLVGDIMKDILMPADREMLPTGVDVRWRNRTAWQRFNMVKRGLLRGDSRRGIWEITPYGRKSLEQKEKGGS